MSFSDPLTFAIDGAPRTLNRISVSENKSVYRSDDGAYEVTISHSYGKRNRHLFRLDRVTFSADVFDPSKNVRNSFGVYVVVDTPPGNYAAANADAITAIGAVLAANTRALAVKLSNGEN
jgi:hypothetical protein